MVSPSPMPVSELKDLGEKLQQGIVLTRIRVSNLPSSRARAKAKRTLDAAERLFVHVSQTVHATASLAGFIEKAFGVTVGDIFSMTGHERIARGAAYTGIVAVNAAVKKAIDELAAVNAAIDEEVKHGEKKPT